MSLRVHTPSLLLVCLSFLACETERVSPPGTASASATGPSTTSGATSSSAGGGGSTGQGGSGASGGGGTGGAGGMGPMACSGPKTGTDTCTGEVVTLGLGSGVTLCGSIDASTGADVQVPICPDSPPSKDRVYDVRPAASGTLTIDLRPDLGSGLDPSAYLFNSNGCPSANAASCDDHFPRRLDWDQSFLPGFHLVVEGGVDANQAPLTGDYVLELSLMPAVCGDWVQNPGEQCDDGNTVNGDGCQSNCTIGSTFFANTCPGLPMFPNVLPHVEHNSTAGHTDDVSPPAMGTCSPTVGGVDEVYRLTATSNTTYTAVIGLDPTCTQTICDVGGPDAAGCWDQVLWVEEGSCANGTLLGCSDATTKGTESVTFAATSGTDYFIYVDGAAPSAFGGYHLCIF